MRERARYLPPLTDDQKACQHDWRTSATNCYVAWCRNCHTYREHWLDYQFREAQAERDDAKSIANWLQACERGLTEALQENKRLEADVARLREAIDVYIESHPCGGFINGEWDYCPGCPNCSPIRDLFLELAKAKR